ncbi:MAG: hypothetical protein A3I44_05160 [Candidatus Sungbacteria bacterium RIFCSPLOWO2_02_FULL_51_17]|uniref:ATP-dependent zinc metalloprotease FtsH n=1 Tax=Candidatus Sungbacteria bacterium RIFCSPHIGHO2_02_FULL_51_29 TaxID=1802273 RepID=A0A1G2KQ43_9BACT|nr:MAG: hypothetical protein A2676_05110 [Candidatus Sungbacteria bacterium RIFCSPHIGHO2_01_FULL_51_22]OHA01540.1 MAG: hypothetical protein A3C16_05205 [Candidatus Sungbacteria bacterium RIFCSPHIGHO2_02_FULL_51_29]OHA11806.1 MAG: hypothetical protein A3I44_05160 [Candidatus Sungbacteria bacterium RIFCSPLOWO2_02_FULL_51_17]
MEVFVGGGGNPQKFPGILFWVVIGIIFFTIVSSWSKSPNSQADGRIDINETQFMQLAAGEYPGGQLKRVDVDKTGHVLKLAILVRDASGTTSEKTATVFIGWEYSRQDAEVLKKRGVIVVAESPHVGALSQVLWSYGPMILMVFVFFFFLRRMSAGANNGAMMFAKSHPKKVHAGPKVTFDDVAGCDEAKEELWEVVQFLKEPRKFNFLGARIPKGVLLIGSPGNGKTLLARAVAGEAHVEFFATSGSEFVEMFVGVGASRVRDLFEQAKKRAPCILFIDEIDAIGKMRGAGIGGGHDEQGQTLNQILVEMDGFDTSGGVIILAATNRPDTLDSALTRAGRFDRQVVVPAPDLIGREAILKVHAKKTKLDPAVDLKVYARATPGSSGADLENFINEAALLAARRNKDMVGAAELDEALDKILMGRERKSTVMSPQEKRTVAYHEAGHTLVAEVLHREDPENSDPTHKVTIIPRGQALGVTQQLPLGDRFLHSRRYIVNRLAVLMGGRAGEEALGEIIGKTNNYTTGAGDDIKRATDLANSMARQFGMVEDLGPRTFGNRRELVFLGRQVDEQQDYSDVTAYKIDEAVDALIMEAHKSAQGILTNGRDKLVRLAEALFLHETLSAVDIKKLVWGTPAITQ